MPWRQLTPTQVQAELTTAEYAALAAILGGGNLTAKTADIVAEWVGTMVSAQYQVLTDGSVPDLLRRHIVADIVWAFVASTPKLPAFQTDVRRKAGEVAREVLGRIARRTYGAIESPFGSDLSTGNWNSSPKIVGRMAPVPQPQEQLQSLPSPLYANPNAPYDDVPTVSVDRPGVPTGLTVRVQSGLVTAYWDEADTATSYNLYRSTTPGQETLLVGNLTAVNYADNTVANGTTYYYRVAAVNPNGVGRLSPEVQAQPQATSI